MASIENALNSLEDAVNRERDLAVKEARALDKAIRRARKDAEARVRTEFKSRRARIKKERKAAEKSIRKARVQIEEALGTGKKSAKKKPSRKKAASKSAARKTAAKKTPAKKTAAKRPARQATRTTRSDATLAYFRKNPGTSVVEAAKAQGVSANAVYPVARKLLEAGKVKKTGSKYTAV